ncbi:MAG: protein kinase [Anaerolineae bacterium]
MSYEPGQYIGPYRISEQLGQGGMASVYKAYHERLDRYVALKVLHPALKQEENFAARFLREAQMIAKLDHPNIVTVYDYDEYGHDPSLVMRYIDGQTLKGWVKRQTPDVDQITDIVMSVGGALSYAHKHGILHRDIKPSNIMIDRDSRIYLTDFGLARMVTASESTLSRDMMLGTPLYISPEQAMGDRNLDERTDIYSLGEVIYELIVGRVPFNADTPFAIVHDHIFTPLPSPTLVNPEVPPSIEQFLVKALAKKREERHASVDSLLEHFQQAVNEAGRDAIYAASQVAPAPIPMRRQAAPDVGEAEMMYAPEPDYYDESAPGYESASVRITNSRQRRPGLWALVGLVLLIITLIGGGYYFFTVISGEIDAVRSLQEGSHRIVETHTL